ncbi:MAG: hypothetical protein FJ290_17615 [Planctomycetes bacterium]|nr:hypothetical protein [Planctomycetota bacterium]
MTDRRMWKAVAATLWLAAAVAFGAVPADPILNNASVWRCCFVTRRPVVRVGGEVKEVLLHGYSGVWMVAEGGKELMPAMESAAPPPEWTRPDFDDQAWPRLPGPFFPSHRGHAYCKEVEDAGYLFFEGAYPTLAAICLRGKFLVPDPAAATDLKLSLAYRGGVVAYLNGQEIARANIPEVERARAIEALAEDYPREVFVKEDGKLISWGFGDPVKCHAQLQKRIRTLSDVAVPARLLRKGVNILAIEAHRAPYHEAIMGQGRSARGYDINWVTVGVTRVELTGGPGVTPNIARPAGIQVWNQDTGARTKASDYGDPCEPLGPIRLAGARNGSFSGAVSVGSPEPLRGLKAAASDLSGPGAIPASAVQVRYAAADKEAGLAFEVLVPEPPADAVVPVWVTARVPRDAKPGDYKGSLTISAEGAKTVTVPIELRVSEWTLPEPKEFRSHVGLTQSPESVALRYKVPLWSPEHWKLLDRSFELLGQAGADDVFITALRRTHFGNEHAMVRWVRRPVGSPKPDLSIAEKYLDLAIKHLGKVPVVCLYCWEPYTGSHYAGRVSKESRGMLYTVVDPATGRLEEAEGPKWGTLEVREFWKPVFDGMRDILKKRGLEGSLMVGVAGDSQPNKDAVEDLRAVAPEAKWVVHSHSRADKLFGQPVGYLADVWGSPIAPDPAQTRLYGWKAEFLRTTFPREGSNTVKPLRTWSPLVQYRLALEGMSAAGLHGFGRMGADFWDVLDPKDPLRSTYSRSLNLLGRYPESNWAQLYLGNSTPYVLVPGPQGALATARFEMIREGAQDVETRIFLEKALLDPASRARLGDGLAQRVQQVLDDRVRAVLLGRTSWLLFAGAQERLDRLYALAGEVAARLRE